MPKLSRRHAKTRAPPRGDLRLHKLFHELVVAWQGHVKDEVALHRKFSGGGADLHRHLARSVKIHETFLRKVRKLSARALSLRTR